MSPIRGDGYGRFDHRPLTTRTRCGLHEPPHDPRRRQRFGRVADLLRPGIPGRRHRRRRSRNGILGSERHAHHLRWYRHRRCGVGHPGRRRRFDHRHCRRAGLQPRNDGRVSYFHGIGGRSHGRGRHSRWTRCRPGDQPRCLGHGLRGTTDGHAHRRQRRRVWRHRDRHDVWQRDRWLQYHQRGLWL